jgi:alpha-galactosidase
MSASHYRTSTYRAKSGTGKTGGSREVSLIEIDSWTYAELCGITGLDDQEREPFIKNKNILIYPGGWQSWSAGWELGANEKLPCKVKLLPDLIKLTNRQDDTPKHGEIVGHFIMYLRTGDVYICLASRTWLDNAPLPPVSFRIDRKRKRVSAEIFCPGKEWASGEVMAELYVFACKGCFALKDTVSSIYQQNFSQIDFLMGSGKPGGYESWYNHYTDIGEKLILEDLAALSGAENFVKLFFLDKNKPAVFQIDDGWEQCVGQWDVDEEKFPNGLQALAEKIETKGFIPGLWIAPFIVTKKSKVFSEKYEWVLKDKKEKPVVAGFNHLWDGRYYCLDLSRDDVLAYVQGLVGKMIDWGFRYIKIDFLYAGFFSGNFAQGGSPFEHYERGCAVLTAQTKAKSGLPVAYLGCGAPLGASFRHFPLSRIGADTREEWDWNLVKLLGHTGRPSAYINLLDTIGRSFFDNILYCNDPDVMFLRTRNCKLTENEKELIALVNFLLASQIMLSDDPLYLKITDIRLTRRIVALYEALSAPLSRSLPADEYGAVRIDRDVFRLISRSDKITGIVNLSNRPYRTPETFEGGKFLLDHRERGAFAPHTISIYTLYK